MGILKLHYICNRYMRGTLAQLVEQRTENPCVPGSIPGGTTKIPLLIIDYQGVLFSGQSDCYRGNEKGVQGGCQTTHLSQSKH